jgi:response regulator of citrate/malate metabolism
MIKLNSQIDVYFAKGNRQRDLIEYIANVQGDKWAWLDYKAAAQAVGVSRSTVTRYIFELVQNNVVFYDNKHQLLKINDKYLNNVD